MTLGRTAQVVETGPLRMADGINQDSEVAGLQPPLSCVAPSHIVADGVIVQCEDLLLVSVQLHHGTAALLVPL